MRVVRKRILLAASLIGILASAGTVMPSVVWAQQPVARQEKQTATTLETLLSEIRNAGANTDKMELVMKLSKFIKTERPNLGPLVLELENDRSAMQRSLLLAALLENEDQALPALSVLIKIAVQDSIPNHRKAALFILQGMGPAEATIGPLQRIVQNEKEDFDTRITAAVSLGWMGPKAVVAQDDVFKLFLENDAPLGGEMLGETLGQFDTDKSREGIMLDLMVKTEKSSVRMGIVRYLLWGKKEISERATGILIDALLKEDTKDGAETIAWGLEKARVLPPGAVEKLAQELGQTQSDKEIASIAKYLRNTGALSQPAILNAYAAHLKQMTYGSSGGFLSEIADGLAETRDPKALAIIFDTMRQCPDRMTCQVLGSSLERAAPFTREMLMEVLTLFRTTKNVDLRDRLSWVLMTADSSFLPVLEEAREDALHKEQNIEISSRLSVIAMEIQAREAKKKAAGQTQP